MHFRGSPSQWVVISQRLLLTFDLLSLRPAWVLRSICKDHIGERELLNVTAWCVYPADHVEDSGHDLYADSPLPSAVGLTKNHGSCAWGYHT